MIGPTHHLACQSFSPHIFHIQLAGGKTWAPEQCTIQWQLHRCLASWRQWPGTVMFPNISCRHIVLNLPTPAFAKAGAAPGTTAGVEPVFVGLPLPCLPPAPTRHQGHSHSMSQPHCTRQTLQRSPGLKPLKCLKPSAAAWTRHSGHSPLLLRAFQPAVCQSLKMPKTLRDSFDQTLRPLSSVVKGVQACRLPGLKCLKRCAAASSRHSGHCPLLLRAFKPAVCQASNA